MKIIDGLVLLGACLTLATCDDSGGLVEGSDGGGANVVSITTGTNGTCPPGQTCDVKLGDNAQVTCSTKNDCAIACMANCSADCDGSSCQIGAGAGAKVDCDAGGKCTITAGNGADISCDERGTCTITALDNAKVSCSDGSTCKVTVGNGGTVDCQKAASCNVTCRAGCNVDCQGAASCVCSGAGCVVHR